MPELPEVESIRLQLEKYLVGSPRGGALRGHKIQNVDVAFKNFEGNSKNLVGGKVKKIRRFGKVLSIDLDNGYSTVIHIKLTGQLIYRGPNLSNPPSPSKKVVGGIPGKHTHVTFHLDKDGKLYYNDVRKFGWIKIVKSDKLQEISFIQKLGPEPLGGLTLEKFKEIVGSTSRSIKTLLMDQTKIGGVGNIYANDALWLAKVHPEVKASKLTIYQVTKLFRAVEEVLKKGMKYGGASELAFVTPDGSEGEYQDYTLAYGKEGQVCERCHKAKFKKITVGGRGTYFCPNCQKE